MKKKIIIFFNIKNYNNEGFSDNSDSSDTNKNIYYDNSNLLKIDYYKYILILLI